MQISIKNVTFKYGIGTPFEKTAVDNISIDIDAGEFVGIIGHTGSGKSTFIQMLNALVVPTTGSVQIDDVNIYEDKKSMFNVRSKVGLVFQYPEHQLFESTIFEDVAFGPKNMGLDKSEVDERVKSALALVGLDSSFYETSPFDLSGGQKRKVAIAGVLAMKPSILVLDEPAAGLDPRSRNELLLNIKKMRDDLGITVILVSHSMEDVSKLVDRIIVFNDGKIYLDGSVNDVFAKTKELQKIGLNSPESFLLTLKLIEKGFNIDKDIFTIDELTNALTNAIKGEV